MLNVTMFTTLHSQAYVNGSRGLVTDPEGSLCNERVLVGPAMVWWILGILADPDESQ